MAIKALGIDHIHFNTRDIRRFNFLIRQLFDFEESRIANVAPLAKYNTTLLLSGAAEATPFLDIFEPTGLDSPIADEMIESGAGVSYVCFRVPDIEAAVTHAASCGVKVLSRDGFGEGMKQVQFDTLDLLGFRLEMVEYGRGWDAELEEVKRRARAGETVEGLSYVD